MLRGIKMIAFDLFGVILTEGHIISNGLMPLLPRRIEKQQVSSLYQQFNLGRIDEYEFWSSLGMDQHIPIRQAFLQGFTLDPWYEMVLAALEHKYRIAIVSNLPPDWADEMISRFEFDRHFSPCLFSGHQRCKKPDQEIYRKLISRSRLQAEQIAFVDDRLENLQTAHELGMTTLYYQKEDEAHGYKPDFYIQQLDELSALFTA